MNLFRDIKGQERALAILRHAIKSEKIAQSYLFQGVDGTGKFTAALYFGMAVNCQSSQDFRPCGECNSCKKFLNFSHPEFVYIFPTPNMTLTESGEIKEEKYLKEYNDYIQNKKGSPWKEFHFSGNIEIRIASIRMLQHKIFRTKREARYKIYLIEHADMMNNKAANSFLKTLEEPPANSIIIMTTSKLNKLLPTIISRCQQVPFTQLPRNIIVDELKRKINIDELKAKVIARIANGSMERALYLAEEGDIGSRLKMLEIIGFILNKDELGLIEFAESYRSSKQISELVEIISHLEGWFSDIAIFKQAPEQLTNVDKLEDLEKFYQLNSNISFRIDSIIDFLENMKFRLMGNVRPQLIIFRIFDKIMEKVYIK